MADRGINNPENLNEVNSIEIDEVVSEFSNTVAQMVEEEETNRATWEQNIDRLKRRRYGVRSPKTHPWPKSANFVIPLIDSDIAEAKPDYVNLLNITPIVNYVPYGPEDKDAATKRQRLNDWRLRTQVKPFVQVNYGIDHLLGDGATVYKTDWHFKTNKYQEVIDIEDFDDQTLSALTDPRVTDDILTEIIVEEFSINMDIEENADAVEAAVKKFREGETVIEMNLVEVVKDNARIVARSLRDDVLVPLDTMIGDDNLDDARFIDDEIWISKNDLKIAMKDGTYKEYSDDEISAWADKSGGQDTRSGISKKSTTFDLEDMVLIHETCVWKDINNDGIEERCILTWPDAEPASVLRLIENPYDHGQWPYTLVKREFNGPGAYESRGISHLDEDFQVGISTELNQTINNGTITNTPQVVHRRGALSNIRNNRYVPGNAVEVNGSTNDYEIKQLGNLSQGLKLQVAQYLKGWANQRVGSKTAALSDPTNLPGAGQGGKKTAKEIGFAQLLQDRPVALNLAIFQAQMARVWFQVDALYEQFGTDDEFELITGENAEGREKLTRREIQGRFDIVPNGRIDNSNPAIRVAKAERVWIMLNNDPFAKQLELRQWVLNEIDVTMAEKLLKTPEELQQEAEQQKQIIAQKIAEQSKGAFTQRQIEDMLDLRKTAAENDLEVEKEFKLSLFQGKKHSEKD